MNKVVNEQELNKPVEYLSENLSLEKLNTLSPHDYSVQLVENRRFGPGFIKPAYEDFCFSNFPGLIEKALTSQTQRSNFPACLDAITAQETDLVIFVFFDSFGWESHLRFSENSQFLQTFSQNGLVCKTTAQFPSTTAAHVTSISTGRPVYETGVCEWFYYEPNAGCVINPFKLSRLGNESELNLITSGMSAREILPKMSFSEDLATQKIDVFQYGPKAFFPSMYGQTISRSCTILPGQSPEKSILELVERNKNPLFGKKEYHYLYISDYDSIRHKQGPWSRDADKNAKEILKTLRKLLKINNNGRTLLIMSADHGQVQINADCEIKINKEVPYIENLLARTPDGEMIRFGGGPRDLFLYSKPGMAEDLKKLIQPALNGAAEVYTQNEAAQLGILGPQPVSEAFKARMGNVIILPHLGHSVVWDEPEFYNREAFRGHHGGLTTQEMETPLYLLRL